MNPLDDSRDPRLEAVLKQLDDMPPSDPQAEALGRAAFLAQAQLLSQSLPARPRQRQTGPIRLFFGKTLSPMPTLATIVLILALALGGTGGAVYAAQDDLPTEPLYSLKLLSEDARLSLTPDPAARANLLLELIQRRTQEMTALSAQSQPALEPVAARLRAEVDAVLQLAAGADDAMRNQLLAQLQTQLEHELQAMTQALASASGEATPVLDQTRALLQNRQQLCQTGLADPQTFRDQLGNLTHGQDQPHEPTGTAQRGPDPSHTPEPTRTAQRGPDPSRTPEPTGTAQRGPDSSRTSEPTGTAQRGPDPSRTPGPTSTALGPGPMNTPVGPGPANTQVNPGPQNTPVGPGPANTQVDPGPVNTPVDPGPANTQVDPGPVNTPVDPGPANTQVEPRPQPTAAGPGGPPATAKPGGRP